MEYIVQRPFTWDGIDYKRGDSFTEEDSHPRLPAMKLGRFILPPELSNIPSRPEVDGLEGAQAVLEAESLGERVAREALDEVRASSASVD